MRAEELTAVVAELRVLEGARLQRVDVVDERELVLELRIPGRTLRLLACARRPAARVHLVDARPERRIPHGPLQAFLRRRIVGQKVARVSAEGRRLVWVLERDTLSLDLGGGRRALAVTPGGGEPPPATPAEALPELPNNAAAAARWAARAPAADDARLRDRLLAASKAEKKKLRRLERNLLSDLERLERYAAEGMRGELLKTALGRVQRGDQSFRAFDWGEGREVEVPLDARLSPKANLERFFARAKKAARGRPRVEARLEAVWQALEDLESSEAALCAAEGEALAELAGPLSADLEGFGGAERAPKPSSGDKPIDRVARRFEAVDGSELRVGRGAEANDALTFRFAQGRDLWLHVRGSPGAHVVLRVAAGRAPSPEAVLDAAHLAVHHSPQKAEGKAEVMIAEVRHVKKTKGAPAGQVGVGSSRTLLVSMEPERLDRLYGRGGPA